MPIHVFVDTNIFLNFYSYSKDDLDALMKVFGSHEHGSAKVYLTEQVSNEFTRNREKKINTALKRFENSLSKPQYPVFIKDYVEYKSLKDAMSLFNDVLSAVNKKLAADIDKEDLQADKLIKTIFKNADIIPVDDKTYLKALKQQRLGNPPGKKGSLGDGINWTILLDKVPESEIIHIISEDGDFFQKIMKTNPTRFFQNNGKTRKNRACACTRH